MNRSQQPQLPQFPKGIVPLILIAVLVIIFIAKSTITIKGGHRGVLYRTLGEGIVTDEPALQEGFQFILPWNKVDIYDVRQQNKFIQDMEVLSSNGLEIKLDVSVLHMPKIDQLGLLHQTKGKNYEQVVIIPEIRSAARSVVGRYTPEQLYSSKRDAIQKEIFDEVKVKAANQYVQINDVLVRDVTLPASIKDAIERKLKQEQESLEYEFRLVKAQKEAEKQIIEAKGKAESNRILSASLTDKILRDKGIEATLKLSESKNSKVVVVGGKDGMPLILGNN